MHTNNEWFISVSLQPQKLIGKPFATKSQQILRMETVVHRIELDGIRYELKSDDTAAIVGYGPKVSTRVAFPGIVRMDGKGYFVNSVSGFKEWSGGKVIIPGSVEFLGEGCFSKCRSLTEVIFEDESNLKRIDDSAFRGSGLKLIRIPKSVEFVGKGCFYKCESLIEVIFEDESNLKRIDDSAFRGSGLKSIRIPKSVEFLGKNCFRWCHSLIEVIFEDESELKRIDDDSFHGSRLKLIRIPKSVEFLGKYCFYECKSLIEVIFERNSSLKEIVLSELKRIDEFAFSFTGLKSIRIPKSVEFVGKKCFSNCQSLIEVIFERNSSLKEIGCQAFAQSVVKSIEIPSKCDILEGALVGVKSVSISRSNPFFIFDGPFLKSKDGRQLLHYFGSASRIGIPNTAEIIGQYCFSECESLIEAIFEDESNLKRIDENAFSCTGLKLIRIPKSVEFLGKKCFCKCESD
jgi:hypothetical protein